MGSNYYYFVKGKLTHIGKHKDGYKFVFREYPTVTTIDDWIITLEGKMIFDELGNAINYLELLRIVLTDSFHQHNPGCTQSFYADFADETFRWEMKDVPNTYKVEDN